MTSSARSLRRATASPKSTHRWSQPSARTWTTPQYWTCCKIPVNGRDEQPARAADRHRTGRADRVVVGHNAAITGFTKLAQPSPTFAVSGLKSPSSLSASWRQTVLKRPDREETKPRAVQSSTGTSAHVRGGALALSQGTCGDPGVRGGRGVPRYSHRGLDLRAHCVTARP